MFWLLRLPPCIFLAAAVLAQQLAQPDDRLAVTSAQILVSIQLNVVSPTLGFQDVVAHAIKGFLSAKTALPIHRWALEKVAEVAHGTYDVVYNAAVQHAYAASLSESVISYVESSELDRDFAREGVSDVKVSITKSAGDPQSSPTSAHPHGHPLVEQLPKVIPGKALSSALPLRVSSPAVLFPQDLRDAIEWFLALQTSTNISQWFLSDLQILSPSGQYVSTFHLMAPGDQVDSMLSIASAYVHNQDLTEDLVDVGATDVVVTLADVDPESSSEDNSPEPEDQDDAGPSPEEMDDPAHVQATPEVNAAQALVTLLLNVTSPVHGASSALIDAMVSFCAPQSGTLKSDWALVSIDSGSGDETFRLDYAIRVEHVLRLQTTRRLIVLVRNRKLDDHLKQSGFQRVAVRLRPQLASIPHQESHGNGISAISSSAATIAASVTGLSLVLCIGAGIWCLVPRGRAADRQR